MAELFARALLAAYKVTGDLEAHSECPDILNYVESATTPRGNYSVLMSMWTYLSSTPCIGWLMEQLTLAEHLCADPHQTLYVGAGSGRMVKCLAQHGTEAHGIDLSDDAIELMTLRGISCEKMDGCNMSYADNSYVRVVVHSNGLLDALEDPAQCISEAARVASGRVIVAGFEIDPASTVPFTWGMEWQGESEGATYYSHPISLIEGILTGLGMTLLLCKPWGEDNDPEGGGVYGEQYLIEARW